MAIALDHLDELFELMLCQAFAGRQRGIRRTGVERRATVRISVVGMTGAGCGFVFDLWSFPRATVQKVIR